MKDLAANFSEVRAGGRGEFQLFVREIGVGSDTPEPWAELCTLPKVTKAPDTGSIKIHTLSETEGLIFYVPERPHDDALYFDNEDFTQAPVAKFHAAACVAGDMLSDELSDRMLDEYGANEGAEAWFALMYDQGCFENLDRWCYACKASMDLCQRITDGLTDQAEKSGYHSPKAWQKEGRVSPTTWRKLKSEMGGEDHPVSGSKLVRFPLAELDRMGWSEPPRR